jgi:hypothetical protein
MLEAIVPMYSAGCCGNLQKNAPDTTAEALSVFNREEAPAHGRNIIDHM